MKSKSNITKHAIIILSILMICFKVFPADPKWENYTYTEKINAVLEDGKYLWIGTEGSGLVKLDKETGEKVFHYKTDSDLIITQINCLLKSSKKELWIGTKSKGVIKYDFDNWEVFNNENSILSSNNIENITEDKNGNIWISVHSNGIAKYDYTNWEIFNEDNSGLVDNTVNNILADKNGILWIATCNGMVKYNGTDWVVFNSSNSILTNWPECLSEDSDGNIWTNINLDTLACYNGNKWERHIIENIKIPHLLNSSVISSY